MSPLLLVAVLSLQAPAYSCRVDDTGCWMEAALDQQERAEHAEGRAKLLEEAVTIGKRQLADADERANRWQKTAEKIAPKPPTVWERPELWLGMGFGLGAAVTTAIAFAIAQAK